ncbi:MAG TPA: hypothetical protein VL119_05585 [Acidimicrobiia bacterium]|nr:hypothetical protein [Acidimicrobiia bacterium]
MRHSTDTYFVRLDGGSPPAGQAPPGKESRRSRSRNPRFEPEPTPRRRRRRRQFSGRNVFIALLVVGLATWTFWASQRPGGVSGTVKDWIHHVRGDVAQVSSDPDLTTARNFYNAQYTATHAYPQMSEADLTGAGIGVGVTIDWCSPQAVVIQGAAGGGDVSRLLLAGKDLGEVTGKYGCPGDLADPVPWK